MQAAQEVVVDLKQGYSGHLTSREADSFGGQTVKSNRLIHFEIWSTEPYCYGAFAGCAIHSCQYYLKGYGHLIEKTLSQVALLIK